MERTRIRTRRARIPSGPHSADRNPEPDTKHPSVEDFSQIVFLPQNMLSLDLDPNVKSLCDEYDFERAKAITDQLMMNMSSVICPGFDLQLILPESKRGNSEEATPPPQIVIPSADPDVYTIPSLDELFQVYKGCAECWVQNFTICHKKFGSVALLGFQNIHGVKVDDLVTFEKLSIKTPLFGPFVHVGGMEVTVNEFFPTDPGNISPSEFSRQLQNDCKTFNWKFISYENGTFKYQIPARVEMQVPGQFHP